MNREEQIDYFNTFTSKMSEVMLKKGNDYSNEDRLSNFKTAGEIIGKSAEEVALVLIAVKVARLGQLIGTDKKPNNESIYDTLLDLANYDILLGMILDEKRIIIREEEEEYFHKKTPTEIILYQYMIPRIINEECNYLTTKQINEDCFGSMTIPDNLLENTLRVAGFIQKDSPEGLVWIVCTQPLPF